jgi:glycosyltransferase involved in cell wall biosynthesis
VFDYDVIFSHQKLDDNELNFLYNIADVQVNIASNEGFGLGTAEAVMAGTPIIVNVTGGLQDQCGFKLKGKHVTYEDYSEIISFHDDRKWKDNPDLTHGEWVKPVWPSSRSLQGSIPTPYIFDDRPRWDDVADRLKEWYDTRKEERKQAGEVGREWMMKEEIGMSCKPTAHKFTRHSNFFFHHPLSSYFPSLFTFFFAGIIPFFKSIRYIIPSRSIIKNVWCWY